MNVPQLVDKLETLEVIIKQGLRYEGLYYNQGGSDNLLICQNVFTCTWMCGHQLFHEFIPDCDRWCEISASSNPCINLRATYLGVPVYQLFYDYLMRHMLLCVG